MRGILLQPKVFGIRQTYLAIFSDKTWNKKVLFVRLHCCYQVTVWRESLADINYY